MAAQPPPVMTKSSTTAFVLGVGNWLTRKMKSSTAMPVQSTRPMSRGISKPGMVRLNAVTCSAVMSRVHSN